MSEQEPSEKALERLSTLYLTIRHWELQLEPTVMRARAAGASWQEIGDRLLISKQAAWKAYHELDAIRSGTTSPAPADDAAGT